MAEVITLTEGADYYENRLTVIEIQGFGGNDTIWNYGDLVKIDAGDDNDILYSDVAGSTESGSNITMLGGNGDDFLDSDSAYSTLSGGNGNDTIWNYGWNVSINGGSGNDYIENRRYYSNEGSNVTISGGKGNDTINIAQGTSRFIEYSNGDGYDTITGFKSDDTLKIAGSYVSQTSGNNLVVQVGNGSILLEGAASLSSSLNIQTVPAGSFGDTGSTTSGGLTTGTSQVISNYTGEPVTVSGFMGANFSGNNFVVNSSAGTLTIQNVTDKIIDLRDGAGNEFIKAYQSSTAGVIDGRGINAYEIIEGSAAGMDVILAGDGGSQLWGGSGSASDAIAGGNGSDIFIGGRFQGSDNFYNVSSADAINLTDASLSDIVGTLEVNGNTIAIGFNTGAIITAQSTGTLSAAINLADGTSWRYNHATHSWQGA